MIYDELCAWGVDNWVGCDFIHYPDIDMKLKIIGEDTLYIKITDKGTGIEDVEQAMQPLFTTCPEGERAGLGFAVMESFTDKLRVKSAPGKGTSVTMVKQVRRRG